MEKTRTNEELFEHLRRQLAELDDQELQQEIASLQAAVSVLTRLNQERFTVLQLRQLSAQRAQQQIQGALILFQMKIERR